MGHFSKQEPGSQMCLEMMVRRISLSEKSPYILAFLAYLIFFEDEHCKENSWEKPAHNVP